MQSTNRIAILVFTLLLLTASAFAQTPAEQLSQMVAELQKTPTDKTLREKIIKLAAEMKPAPVVSDTAIEFEGRAQFAFKKAQNEAEFVNAAAEYEKAVAIAPWVSGYYSDLCTIYEKANKFEDAERNCEFYMLGLTDPTQITDTKRRIAGLKYGIEQNAAKKIDEQQAAAAKAAADTPEAREAALLSKVDGARFVDHKTPESMGFKPGTIAYDEIFDIKDRTLSISIKIYYVNSGSVYGHKQPGEYFVERISYRDGAFTQVFDNGDTAIIRIRPDGQALTKQYNNAEYKFVIPRR